MPDRAIRQSYRGFSIRRVIEARCLGFTKKITDASSAALSCRQKGHIFPRKPSTAPLSARSLKRDWGKVPNLYLFERYIANAMEGHREFMIADDLPLKISQSGTISTYIFYFCVFLSAFVISANQALPLCFRRNYIFSIANHLHERHDINKHKLGKNNLPKLDE